MANSKPRASLSFLGHVDSGKSTIAGHLLALCGSICPSSTEYYHPESSQVYKYAFIFGRRKEERKRPITIDVSYHRLETEEISYTLIDLPGHYDFTKNLIFGLHGSDFGLLVVSAALGEFEAGISREGQTREHPLLAFTFGIKELICCVNKMDYTGVDWSQTRYEEVTAEMGQLLGRYGYTSGKVTFVPVSGWFGDNLIAQSSHMPWYDGPTLLQTLNHATIPQRSVSHPLRLPIRSIYSLSAVGTIAIGRIETGTLRANQAILISPGHLAATVTSIQIHSEPVTESHSGDIVAIRLDSVHRSLIRRGMVVSDFTDNPAKECRCFLANIIVVSHPGRIRAGYTPVMYCHMAAVPCRLVEIVAKIDRRTKRTIEERPECLKNGEAGECKFAPIKPISVETFGECQSMGRFALRDMRMTVAVGVIKKVEILDWGDEGWRGMGRLTRSEG